MRNAAKRPLRLVLENGEPAAVILDINEYRELLERLEDATDLKLLDRMRKKPLKFRKLEEFLAEYRLDLRHSRAGGNPEAIVI